MEKATFIIDRCHTHCGRTRNTLEMLPIFQEKQNMVGKKKCMGAPAEGGILIGAINGINCFKYSQESKVSG